jgi:hypothetical protein
VHFAHPKALCSLVMRFRKKILSQCVPDQFGASHQFTRKAWLGSAVQGHRTVVKHSLVSKINSVPARTWRMPPCPAASLDVNTLFFSVVQRTIRRRNSIVFRASLPAILARRLLCLSS